MENTDEIVKKFPQGDPFKAPEGYFDQLSVEISEKVNHNYKSARQFIHWKHPLKLAASFALLVILTYAAIVFIKFSTNNPTKTLAEASDTLDAEYAFLDEKAIVHYMADTSVVSTDPNADSMIEFLIDQNVSYELLADYY